MMGFGMRLVVLISIAIICSSACVHSTDEIKDWNKEVRHILKRLLHDSYQIHKKNVDVDREEENEDLASETDVKDNADLGNEKTHEDEEKIEVEDSNDTKYLIRKTDENEVESFDDTNGKKTDDVDESIETLINTGKDGDKMIENAMEGNVSPDSPVVKLIESFLVESDYDPNGHEPYGIKKIAKQSKVAEAEEHDSHPLTPQQKEETETNIHTGGNRKRNFLKHLSLWPGGIIPYEIDPTNQNFISTITKAIKEFTELTCIRWVPRESAGQDVYHSDSKFINFFNGSGCWSYIGMWYSKQPISLQIPGCLYVPIAIHEMMHAMGMEHEHSREDRDAYTTMLWGNIQNGRRNNNFEKTNTYDRNPYDQESVLQYGLNDFSDNGKPTIEFKERRLDFLADSATGLMYYDIKDINDAYNCSGSCKKPLLKCQNEGFVNHKCVCYCPPGLTGTLCETPVSDQGCGRSIINIKSGSSVQIKSPGYSKGAYPTGMRCTWLILAPPDMYVSMTIDDMDLRTNNGACDHWLEIKFNLLGQSGPKLCGILHKRKTYVTTPAGDHTKMLLRFDSAFASKQSAERGFLLTVNVVGEGCSKQPCKRGICTDTWNGGFRCQCDSGYTGTQCDIISDKKTKTCTFESKSDCILENVYHDDADWSFITSGTSSPYTGPDQAHSGIGYIYAEASYPVEPGFKYHFTTSVYLPAGDVCLTFWYCMYGSTVGTLSVLQDDKALWTESGNQGKKWIKSTIDIKVTSLSLITFEAVIGSSWDGDIALDDISFSFTSCAD